MAPTTGKTYQRRWWTLVVLSISLLVISLDNTILNVALPTIERDLGASASDLQWIVDSYTLVFAGLLLTMGSLGDRFGRRRALVAGLGVFGAGSLLSALAGSADALIASRALMGIGGALIMPSTLSILTNVFPAEERPKAIGIWAAVAGLGIAIGPVGGGWLIEHFDWSSVFLVNLPIVALALAAAPALVPESRDPEQSRLDPVGAALSMVGLGALTWAIIEGQHGWTDPATLAGFGVALVALTAFVAWELRTSSPMLDVRLFRVSRFSGASVSIALVFFSLFGAIFFLTMYLQEVKDYEPLAAGLRVTPVALGLVLGGPLSAKLAQRLGTRLVVASRADDRRDRDGLHVRRGRGHRVLVARGGARPARLRHGRDHGAGDRVDHELAAARPRGRGLGHERHRPHGRRHPRRGDPREPPVRPVRCRHGGLPSRICPSPHGRPRRARSAARARWRSASAATPEPLSTRSRRARTRRR